MGIGENVGCNVGEDTGSSGSTYVGVTPIMVNINAESDSNLLTVNFNTGVKDDSLSWVSGYTFTVNEVPTTVVVWSTTEVGNGVLVLYVRGFLFVEEL